MAANSRYQKAPATPVLALSEMVRGWWPGVSQDCAVPNCDGQMYVDPPTMLPGRLLCGNCGRSVADVVEKRRAYGSPAFASWSREWDACRDCHRTDRRHASKGRCTVCITTYYRAQKPATDRPCLECGAVVGHPGHTRCARCRYRIEKARKERAG